MSTQVYLIGGGPGDPGLFTLRGREALSRADVVVYDALINDALLSYCKEGVEKIFVGKRRGWHELSQPEISQLLVERAKAGKIVARLKGGDPFLFGRGGEEALALVEANLSFEVIPGVTSALSVPAYAGIPVTHREMCRVLTICTGHSAVHGAPPLDFSLLARTQGTLVFLMSHKFMQRNVEQLLAHGMKPETPAAVIEWGTLPRQRVVTATLSTIVSEVEAAKLGAPAILVVGDVVNLREKISWYVPPPLAGKKVLVTRAREQSEEIREKLLSLGAAPVLLPMVSFEKLTIDTAVFSSLSSFQWIVFTSANAVRFFFEELRASKRDSRALASSQIICVGKKTAEALSSFGIDADVYPQEERSEAILPLLSGQIAGQHFLLPRPKEVAFPLASELTKRGGICEELILYQNVAPQASELNAEEIDIVTFASPSAVENLCKTYPEALSNLQTKRTVVIGPTTETAAKKFGFTNVVTAETPSIDAMLLLTQD
jgi:uroporphyrinogen III methyltransferase/synthase